MVAGPFTPLAEFVDAVALARDVAAGERPVADAEGMADRLALALACYADTFEEAAAQVERHEGKERPSKDQAMTWLVHAHLMAAAHVDGICTIPRAVLLGLIDDVCALNDALAKALEKAAGNAHE
jgi:hypothetical protein